jgi:hypothetical protein
MLNCIQFLNFLVIDVVLSSQPIDVLMKYNLFLPSIVAIILSSLKTLAVEVRF